MRSRPGPRGSPARHPRCPPAAADPEEDRNKSDQATKLVISGVLLLHGLGHGGALGALLWIGLRPGTDTDAWRPPRSCGAPSLPSAPAPTPARAFWVLSLV